jgi:hypothetical protein
MSIRHIISTRIHDAPLVDFPDKHGIVGFDTKGNPIEALYNPVDDDTISVFHARKLQQDFIAKLSI